MEPAASAKTAVVSISSHVVRGTVGNRAAGFALETLGHPVWSVPTVTLPWHPGRGRATRLVPDDRSFAALVADLCEAPWLDEVGAILTGYFGSAEQIEPVRRLVDAVRRVNPAVLYVCDPVLGDGGDAGGRLYQPEPIVELIRDRLLPIADVATPNRFELEFLTGLELADNGQLLEAAVTLGPPRMLVTSAFAMLRGGIANLWTDGREALLAEHRRIEEAPHGPGDLTAAVLLSRLLGGASADRALQTTTAAVYEILARTAKRGADELTLELDSQSLRTPMAMVQLRRLAMPGGLRA